MENTLSRLTKAFKENKIQPLFELQGGMMNKSYVIEFEGKKYVYYQPTVQANEMVDRILERDNHLKVYSLGITSKNLAFFDTGVKINEYIEGQSLNYLESYDIKKVAKILKKLHESHLSSGKDYLPFKQIEKYENQIKELKIATSNDYKTLLDLVKSEQSFLESQRKVLCHNDFQKSNIIKSNSDEYFMIDFEFMMDNDPIFDIAAFGNNNVIEGYELLKEYFGNSLTKEEIKRFFLWRIVLSLQWSLVALIKDFKGEGKTHNIDFKGVSDFFISNAKDAKEMLFNIVK